MSNNSDFRDQAYQFFIEEAPELLQVIESGLLNLRQEKNTAKVHELMRAAHSIKGGAASVGLEEIKTIAHRLEDIFKGLYSEEVILDQELESLLLEGYDCLKNPLTQQMETGNYDRKAALADSEPVWAKIEAILGDALNQEEEFMPSSSDLGIDIVSSIFEVDVQQGINKLTEIIANPEEYSVGEELQNQAEVFMGLGELLNLPGFTEINQTAIEALAKNPDQALEITKIMLVDVQASREAVLAGDRTSGGKTSPELVALVTGKKQQEQTQQKERIDVSDHAYRFFVEEVPELLELIESGLLTLREEKTTGKVHEIMRAAHSIKGGAASVGLETIKNIAHKLEDYFKALYGDEIEIDSELESLLLEGYDCLKNPLMQQITTGKYDTNAALSAATPVWEKIEARLGDALNKTEEYLPSSSDLGVDLVSSIFEVDIGEGIERLETVVKNPEKYSVADELRERLEVFSGLAEILNLPGFKEITQTAIEALAKNLERALEITQLTLADLKASRERVMAGDRTSGGTPSPELVALVRGEKAPTQTIKTETVDVRDHAYQFFIEEAPELLELIESGLLTLRQEKSTAKVHEIMRAAHSIKGGAASVGLETIKEIAHKLEDYFKALYSDDIEIDQELESWLLAGYDCLRNPLMEQIETGEYNADAALSAATPVWAKIEARLGDALTRTDNYIPSSSDLGVDVVHEMFLVDVAQEIERLENVVANPENNEVAGELRATLDVFGGFGEFLNLPGFAAIAITAKKALENYPSQALEITKITLKDIKASREAVLAGDRKSGGQPSTELITFAEGKQTPREITLEPSLDDVFGDIEIAEKPPAEPSLDDVFGDIEIGEKPPAEPSLDDVFGDIEIGEKPPAEPSLDDVFGDIEIGEKPPAEPSIDDVFGDIEITGEEEEIGEKTNKEPSIDDVFGDIEITGEEEEIGEKTNKEPSIDDVFGDIEITGEEEEIGEKTNKEPSIDDVFGDIEITGEEASPETLEKAVENISQIYEKLPTAKSVEKLEKKLTKEQKKEPEKKQKNNQTAAAKAAKLSVRVDLERLERMNNLVGELAINRNSISLQNDQLQAAVKELLNRFNRFGEITNKLRETSDQIVVKERRYGNGKTDKFAPPQGLEIDNVESHSDFDSLEMDSYSTMYSMLQSVLEQMIQVEEAVDDIVLFAKQSTQTVEQQRQMLNRLRDELMWARMLPLSEVLNRFPRVLRDLSAKHKKQVNLKLSGTSVLVDKAALEKLYDPLLHLLRNAFDHGIETPEIRNKKNKQQQGTIEIAAYHQGNQTIIEMKDDGQGLNLDKIGRKAVEKGLLSEEQLAVIDKENLLDFIFEPGFSTASQVSELSGRGVGLDVVRSQLRSLKGKINVNSIPDKGTTFILSLPLTLTIDKLLVCLAGTTPFALPSDSIEEILIPTSEQIKTTGQHRFVRWQTGVIPVYRLNDLLQYNCYKQEVQASKSLVGVSTPADWALPLLLLRRGQQVFALEVERLVTEQELVIKPFGNVMAAPSYTYGCTILGDGTLIPVINGTLLLESILDLKEPGTSKKTAATSLKTATSISENSGETNGLKASTVLVVDDSAAMRRTLAFSLEKVGYRVLQARDGREALEQLQNSASNIQLVICDIEMPNMNGFEFLGQRRRYPDLLTVPVAMLTSRSNDKHRQLATHLGANAYFTKPYIEQKFLESIKKMMGVTINN